MYEQFETYYGQDWKNRSTAKYQRDMAAKRMAGKGLTTVKAEVKHPVYGRGYEVYGIKGRVERDSVCRRSDVRVLPNNIRVVQTPAPVILRQEEWADGSAILGSIVPEAVAA